jgi:hypothetical protein
MVGKAGTAFARRLTPALSTYANRRVFLPNAPVARSVGFRQRCRGPAGGRRAVVHGGSRDVGPRLKLTIDGSDLGVTNPARSRPLRQQLQVRVDPRGEPTVPRRVTACANKHNKPHGLIVGSRGRVSKPTTAAQPWPGELVFMPPSRPSTCRAACSARQRTPTSIGEPENLAPGATRDVRLPKTAEGSDPGSKPSGIRGVSGNRLDSSTWPTD